MSVSTTCDGCGSCAKGKEPPKEWLKVSIRNGHGTPIARGDFCTPDCLARFLASENVTIIDQPRTLAAAQA